jgi:hypothetical protein
VPSRIGPEGGPDVAKASAPESRCARCDGPLDVVAGDACWACLTLQERRRHKDQCERCGAQFYDDCRDSDRGWIIDWPDRVLCPSCITAQEDADATARFVAVVEEGERRCAAEGRRYPPDLRDLKFSERARVEIRQLQDAELNRERARLEGEG